MIGKLTRDIEDNILGNVKGRVRYFLEKFLSGMKRLKTLSKNSKNQLSSSFQ